LPLKTASQLVIPALSRTQLQYCIDLPGGFWLPDLHGFRRLSEMTVKRLSYDFA
jgi:hypothetical protein